MAIGAVPVAAAMVEVQGGRPADPGFRTEGVANGVTEVHIGALEVFHLGVGYPIHAVRADELAEAGSQVAGAETTPGDGLSSPMSGSQGQVLGGESSADGEQADSEEELVVTEDKQEEGGLLNSLFGSDDEEGGVNWPLVIGGALLVGAGVYWEQSGLCRTRRRFHPGPVRQKEH